MFWEMGAHVPLQVPYHELKYSDNIVRWVAIPLPT